jgi:glucose 1-dehydrogenase
MQQSGADSRTLILENQVAIVTGAAKGIGRGIALQMAQEGAHVVIVDIDEEGAQETAGQLQPFDRKSLVVPADVSNEEHNERLVDSTLSQFGTVDILVNNAGANTEGGLLEMSREGIYIVLNTNLVGPFFLTRRVAKEMVKRKIRGSILFTSSIHGQIKQLHPAYTASKAALEMFVRDIALELAEHGIRVNAVTPGAIDHTGRNGARKSLFPAWLQGNARGHRQ